MTAFASGQQVAANPGAMQIGVPVQTILEGYTFGAQNATDVLVGSAVFYQSASEPALVQQTSAGAATNPLAGIVLRGNSTPMPFSSSYAGFSSTISAGQTSRVATRGSIPILISVANEGSSPLPNSVVWAMTADGTWQTQIAGTAVTGGIATNFRVKQVQPGFSTTGVVLVTNTQNVGA